MNRTLALLAVASMACGPRATEGVADVSVSYVRSMPGAADCVVVTVSDVAAPEKNSTQSVVLPNNKPTGTLVFAVLRGAGWSNDVRIESSLHLGSCDAAAVATAAQQVELHTNTRADVTLVLNQP